MLARRRAFYQSLVVSRYRTMPDRYVVARATKRISRRVALLAAAGLAVLALAGCHRSGSGEPVKTVDGVTVYLGVVPSSVVTERPSVAVQAMHDTGRVVPNSHHVLIALFDAESGERLSGTVTADVSSRHGDDGTKPLEAMNIGGVVTYGNYFSMEDSGTYTIDVGIQLTGGHGGTRHVTFRYEHPH